MNYANGEQMMEFGQMLQSTSRGLMILVVVCAAFMLVMMLVRKKKPTPAETLETYSIAAFTSHCLARVYEDKNPDKLGAHYVAVFTRTGQPICEYAEYDGQRILGVAEINDSLYLYTEETEGGMTYIAKWIFSPEKEEFVECVE